MSNSQDIPSANNKNSGVTGQNNTLNYYNGCRGDDIAHEFIMELKVD